LIGAAKVVAQDTTRSRKKRMDAAKKTLHRALTLFGKAGHAADVQRRKHKVTVQCSSVLAQTISHASSVGKRLRSGVAGCTP